VVFATFIGWKVLKEESGIRRILSSILIVAGLVTLVLGR
jgi:drug/metabolite transporter (DMT)-like permease